MKAMRETEIPFSTSIVKIAKHLMTNTSQTSCVTIVKENGYLLFQFQRTEEIIQCFREYQKNHQD